MAADLVSIAQTCPLDTCLRILQGNLKQDPFPEQSETDGCSMLGADLLQCLEEGGRITRSLRTQGRSGASEALPSFRRP